jgi:hypothetical protein
LDRVVEGASEGFMVVMPFKLNGPKASVPCVVYDLDNGPTFRSVYSR